MLTRKFSEEVVAEAFNRFGSRCECRRISHLHGYRCPRLLVFQARGRERLGAWEAHHRDSNGDDSLSNCEILCWPCHKATQSFGG